ncbi:MAG: DUF1987 domain-containing protein [Bacteroidales bacterium]|jgi:hypothetical protein
MELLRIEKQKKTPFIELDPVKGVLTIEGRSIPEDPESFYNIVYSSMIDYYQSPQNITTFNFQFEYINSGSSKFILRFFNLIKKQHDAGHECIVNWYYEEDDENILDLGQHYKNTFRLPFKFVEIYG